MTQYILRIMLSAFFLIQACGLLAQTEGIVLNEKFENNRRNWDDYNTSSRLAKVWKNKYLLITRKNKIGLLTDIEVPLDQNYNFSISTTLTKLEGHDGDGYGLCWGKKDKDNCFTFTLSGRGFYEIGKWENGKWQYISRRENLCINKWEAENKVEVRKKGERILFLINDSLVENQPFEKFFGKRIGFVVYNKIEVEASNLLVKGTSTKPGPSEISNMRRKIVKKKVDNLEISKLHFEATNGSNKLSNPGKGHIKFKLKNLNNKESRELKLWINCMEKIQRVSFPDEFIIAPMPGNSTIEISIPLQTTNNFISSVQKLRLQIVDSYGLVARPQQINIELKENLPGRIIIEKIEINDTSEDTGGSFIYGNGNNIPEPGEAIQVTISIKNTGEKLNDLKAKIYEEKYSPHLALDKKGKEYFLGDIKKGESLKITFDFFSSKAYILDEIPFNVRFTENGGTYYKEQNLGLKMNKKPAKTNYPNSTSTQNKEIEFEEKDVIIETGRYDPETYVLIFGCSVNDPRNSAQHDALRFYSVCRKVLGIPDANILLETNNRFHANDLLNIVNDYGWLARKAKQDNFNCIIYFSGSGIASNNKTVVGLMNCLNPVYAQIRPDSENLFSSLEQLQANKILIISDPAFSGNRSTDELSLAENSGIIIPGGEPKFKNNSICYIASGGLLNYSQAHLEKKHNLFSYLFMDVFLMDEVERTQALNKLINGVKIAMEKYKTYGEPIPKVGVYGNKRMKLL
ncbi:MAG: hypothetical protein U9R19_13875 [Bacteroidota bacterium]|nr:hypothetical protein [Bacteroidota bacterium]